jgi:predicted RNA-binding protein Jag
MLPPHASWAVVVRRAYQPSAARQAASTTRTGRRLSPFVKFERRRAGGPMSSIERRIVHLRLKEEEGVGTRSEGEEPYRYVVVEPE